MIGGYQILDLRGIDLQISGSASNITDPYVLKQLLSLRDHIDKAYNFNKPLVNQLKPVLIRFRDKKNGEKTEGATFGEMSVVGNYYTFKITGRISGQFTLIINVAFHEVTNAYGNKEWLINTAKIQLADASDVLEGDIAIDGDLTVSGKISGKISFENIEDSEGNKRFIEGNGTPATITGVTSAYCKWSLSGSHLMFVYAGTCDDETVLPAEDLVTFELPSWILSKIYPVFDTNKIAIIPVKLYGSDWQTQDANLIVLKYQNYIIFYLTSSVTLNADRSFRIQFDLLIDNDYE